ncbi:MAG: hypothetical protein KAR42_18145, partial [candidate division Zixibacteria bacterium]|nr:hypothetical protein [candidate division Zixibacteria bacterium]
MSIEIDLTKVPVELIHKPTLSPFDENVSRSVINIHNCHPIFSEIMGFVAKANFTDTYNTNFLTQGKQIDLKVTMNERVA